MKNLRDIITEKLTFNSNTHANLDKCNGEEFLEYASDLLHTNVSDDIFYLLRDGTLDNVTDMRKIILTNITDDGDELDFYRRTMKSMVKRQSKTFMKDYVKASSKYGFVAQYHNYEYSHTHIKDSDYHTSNSLRFAIIMFDNNGSPELIELFAVNVI